MLLALLAVLLGALLAPSYAAPPLPHPDASTAAPDSVAGVARDLARGVVPDTVEIRPRVDWSFAYDLASLYTPTRGFGLGGRVRARHLGWAGSAWTLGAVLAQRYQRGQLYLFTQDPYHARVFGLLGVYARTTSEQPFFGTGPRTTEALRVRLDHTTVESEARLGWYVFDHTGLLVQPFVRLRWDRVGEITDAEEDLPAFDAASQASVAEALGRDRTGLYAGASLATDTRDRAAYATRGWLAQAAVSRYAALDGSGLGFTQATGTVYGFFPLEALAPALEHHVVQASLHVATRRGAPVEALPFYYLSVLDFRTLAGFSAYRLTGRDALVAGVSYRLPVPSLLDLVTDAYATDLIVSVQAGNVYDRLEDEVSARLTFEGDLRGAGARVPLRPAVALGGALLDADRSDLHAMAYVGLNAEGFVAAEFSLVYDLRGFRPPIR